MTAITLYGGVGEVGGNKILVSDGKHKCFLDFGMSFKAMGMYFDEFMKPRKLNGMGDLLEMGILPDLKGIYRQDYLKKMKREPSEKPAVDGVFLSHAHADHASHISYLRPDIPIYGSLPTCRIMQALSETGAAFSELMVMKEAFRFRPHKKDPGKYTKMKGAEVEIG
ncbi:MAG: MBL fold metallo-hydrolase, partial [Candidatus Aenigmarchaeota archaeon]|nr:MBL fold metallo-hydrolase [Candidatus Aenigmarchaeota archaeon]